MTEFGVGASSGESEFSFGENDRPTPLQRALTSDRGLEPDGLGPSEHLRNAHLANSADNSLDEAYDETVGGDQKYSG